VARVQLRGTLRARGHNPDVLHGATFEYPAEMDLALAAMDITISVMIKDIEFPTSDQPSVCIGGRGNLLRTARSR
jgi:hypothetical protein